MYWNCIGTGILTLERHRNTGEFFLLIGILLLGLYGLNSLRGEAIRLVLDPLQRMLKIVLRCKCDPLHKTRGDHFPQKLTPDSFQH